MPSSQASNDDVDMNPVTEAELHHVEPPPRLAARFHRKSSARRRSSAHSSRCSSLSSLSRSSALSCHGGPQSTHIAQHLRRASIIESRKARLADRAAHAERVRLRAAAVKAAPRATYSEEKALAAQAAREKLLAEITARCEKEVRRAKKVAEEMREKRAAEDARRRDELEEKYAGVARRDSVHQPGSRRPRATWLAAVEERKINPVVLKKLTQVAAAKLIQRAWRSWHRRTVAQNFIALAFDTPRLSHLPFEEVTRLISEDESLLVAKAALKQLGLLDSGNDESDRGAVRVFLSAYMILAHPVQAFSHGGNDARERELASKGQALVESFEKCNRILAAAKTRPIVPPKAKEQLQFYFNDFNATFHAWKSRDLSVLLDVMVNSFVNLDLILLATKDELDGNVADEYQQAVRQEQIKLLARLKRLAGPEAALSRVRNAVRKARKERASKQKSTGSNHIPRGLSENEAVLSVSAAEPMTPPATPPRSLDRQDAQASSFIKRLGETMTVLPTNREIAHEMQIMGRFEVQQQPWTDSRKMFMNSLRQSMRESMQSGGVQVASNWTHAMAVLIKDKLLNMISKRHPLYERIDDFLDIRLIEQQSRNGIFSYDSFFEAIGQLIAQICSPGRDDLVKSFASDTNRDTIDRLFALIDIIDLMTLDHINFQFRLAARSVIENGHEHEFQMFERDLQDGRHGLEQLKSWWSVAKENVPSTMLTNNAAYGNAIYAKGLVELVLSNSALAYSDLPETLRLDWIRLLELRAKAFHMVATSSVLLTTKIRLRRNREALWAKDAERLMNLDPDNCEASRIVSLIESGHMMPDTTKEGLLNFVNRVLPSASGAARRVKLAEQSRLDAIQQQRQWDPSSTGISVGSSTSEDAFSEQIATFILKSLREHVFARLSAASTAEKVRVSSSASEVLARAGMPEFVAEVGSLVDTLERIRSVDLKAHGKWYDEVANAIANE